MEMAPWTAILVIKIVFASQEFLLMLESNPPES